MKVRLLRKHLNNTTYTIQNCDDYIAVGNGYVHKLISVDKKTLEVKYGLDTFKEGRKAIKNPELEFIWDKCTALVATGEMSDIINGNDVIENPLPVFTARDGKLIESHTDEYGFPNTTYDGELMYDNTHFKKRKDAIEMGIKDSESYINMLTERVSELEEQLQTIKDKLLLKKTQLEYFESLKKKKQ